jgi:hypothetical protein
MEIPRSLLPILGLTNLGGHPWWKRHQVTHTLTVNFNTVLNHQHQSTVFLDPPKQVKVANGDILISDKMMPNLSWWCNGFALETRMRVLDLNVFMPFKGTIGWNHKDPWVVIGQIRPWSLKMLAGRCFFKEYSLILNKLMSCLLNN